MRLGFLSTFATGLFLAVNISSGWAGDAAALRLVPFPKEVEMGSGRFRLDRPLVVTVSEAARTAAETFLIAEFGRAGLESPTWQVGSGAELAVRLSGAAGAAVSVPILRGEAGDEDYALTVTKEEVVVVAPAVPGLIHGLATLGQLVRANRQDHAILCLTIHDWPSIRWRVFQDDITRGPSTKLLQLRRDVARGAMLKLNVFTYYMQHQFAFTKHPLLGPKDGSLTVEELAALVPHGRELGVEILGNQQSFAHMQHTLAHEEYAHLKEDDRTLSPVREGTYALLDDLYSDVLPILPFEMFNVCCDETWGLGTKGPSKALADEIGPGGVYVQHIGRVHDLVHGKYGKRMMMWGDIILHHPDKLDQIPKDVVMLTWGYNAQESFEDQIIPFAESGYEFFVCPGVNNWSRVLPDFARAATNIHHFVRDGVKHGAVGVLNTSWDDDGENLNGPNWYGFAWGAECAWNGSETPQEDFDRRIGAVLLGEPGEHFGQAIGLLSDTRLSGMMNRTFWEANTGLIRCDAEKPDEECLVVVREAIEHLQSCRKAATVDADLVETVLFGARRLEQYYESRIDRIRAATAYDQALKTDGEEVLTHLDDAAAAIARTGDAYEELRGEWETLWNRENKPHALDWSLARYDQAIDRLDKLSNQLVEARRAAAEGRALPAAVELGLQLWARPEKLATAGRIESSLGNYQDYYPEFACDGNPETFYWSDRGLTAGDHFTLVLDEPRVLKSVTFLLGTDRYRQEYVHAGVLEAQGEDGSWTKLTELNSARVESGFPAARVRAIRLRVEEPQPFWLIVREIEVEP